MEKMLETMVRVKANGNDVDVQIDFIDVDGMDAAEAASYVAQIARAVEAAITTALKSMEETANGTQDQ